MVIDTYGHHSCSAWGAGQHLPWKSFIRVPRFLTRAAVAHPMMKTVAASSWPPLVDPAGPGPVIATRNDQIISCHHRLVVRDGETYGYRLADSEIARFAVISISTILQMPPSSILVRWMRLVICMVVLARNTNLRYPVWMSMSVRSLMQSNVVRSIIRMRIGWCALRLIMDILTKVGTAVPIRCYDVPSSVHCD